MDECHRAAIGCAFQVRGETGDVMRASDHDGARAVHPGHRERGIERATYEPGARQPLPVPRLRDGCRVDDCRCARLRHSPLRELVEIIGEQRQTVRRVSHQVAVDQHGADIGGDVVAHADPHQQLDRVRAERRGIVARGGIGCGERRHGGGAVVCVGGGRGG